MSNKTTLKLFNNRNKHLTLVSRMSGTAQNPDVLFVYFRFNVIRTGNGFWSH